LKAIRNGGRQGGTNGCTRRIQGATTIVSEPARAVSARIRADSEDENVYSTTVVELLNGACEVEFSDDEGTTYAEVALAPHELLVLKYRPTRA